MAGPATTDEPEAALREAERLMNQARGLSQRIATFGKRIVTEGDALADEVSSVSAAIQREHNNAARRLVNNESWVEVIKELENARGVVNGNGPGGDLRVHMRVRTCPAIIAWMLGSSTNVVSMRKDQSIKLKENYHAFRTRCAYVMIAFSAMLHVGLLRANSLAEVGEPFTFTPVIIVGNQLFLCWLLFFYTASALRESVLRMNGSHIRPWWIHHHYWSMGACTLMLSLPVDSPSFVRAVRMFLYWAILQGVVMLMQNRYQRRRMYTRVALGKATAMDVVSGETSGTHGQLLLLYPMLFSLQGLQVYLGIEMIRQTYWSLTTAEGILDPEKHESDLWGSRGVCLVGVLLMYMALMNFTQTVATITEKVCSRERAIARLTAMRAHSVRSVKSHPTGPRREDTATWPSGALPDSPVDDRRRAA